MVALRYASPGLQRGALATRFRRGGASILGPVLCVSECGQIRMWAPYIEGPVISKRTSGIRDYTSRFRVEGRSRLHACAHGDFIAFSKLGVWRVAGPGTCDRAPCVLVWQPTVHIPSDPLPARILFLEHCSRTTRFLMLSPAEAFGKMVVTARWVGLSSQGPGLRVGTRTLHKEPACCPGQGNTKAWPYVVLQCGVGLLLPSRPPPTVLLQAPPVTPSLFPSGSLSP